MKNTERIISLSFEVNTAGVSYPQTLDMPTGYKKIKAVKFFSPNLPPAGSIDLFQIDEDASQIQRGVAFGALQDPMMQWDECFAQEVVTDRAKIAVTLKADTVGFVPFIAQVLFKIDK